MVARTWKGKRDIRDPERYSDITLLSQALTLLERILDFAVMTIIDTEIDRGEPAKYKIKERNRWWIVYDQTDCREEKEAIQKGCSIWFLWT